MDGDGFEVGNLRHIVHGFDEGRAAVGVKHVIAAVRAIIHTAGTDIDCLAMANDSRIMLRLGTTVLWSESASYSP